MIASETVPSPFSTNNLVPRGNGTSLVASNIFDNGTNVTIGNQNPDAAAIAAYKFLVYGANESIGVDNTGVTIGDVIGTSFGNYFYTDFESSPRFAFMGANVGVGTLAPNYPVDIETPLGSSAYGLNHTDGDIIMSTYVGNGGPIGGSIGTQSNHPFFIYAANGGAKLTVLPDGNVGIGTFTPTANLEVSGYTKLGSNVVNPAIQVATFSGTTAATQGGSAIVNISPVTAAQIISITVMVDYTGSGSWLSPRYNGNPGYDFTWYQNASSVFVINTQSGVNGGNGSSFILSMPIRVMVTYVP